jgi:hypothetical protein
MTIPLCAALSICVWLVVLNRSEVLHHFGPFLVLAGISIAAWLLVVLGFLVPSVLHVWPQAAVFGLALGGAVTVHQCYPLLFSLTLIALISYIGAVWISSPLQAGVAIDAAVSLVIAALISLELISKLMPITSSQGQ